VARLEHKAVDDDRGGKRTTTNSRRGNTGKPRGGGLGSIPRSKGPGRDSKRKRVGEVRGGREREVVVPRENRKDAGKLGDSTTHL